MEASRQFIYAVLFLLIAAFIFSAMNAKGEFGTPADWAQAVGSVAAIAAVWWQTNKTLQASMEPARTARIEFVNAVATSVEMALSDINATRIAIRYRDLATIRAEFLFTTESRWTALKAVSQIPIEKWPSADLYVRTIALYDSSHLLLKYVEGFLERSQFSQTDMSACINMENVVAIREGEFQQSLSNFSRT